MARKAVLDVDGTIISCNSSLEFAKNILLSRAIPKRYILRFISKAYLILLIPFSFLLPVYLFLQREGSRLYKELSEVVDRNVLEDIASKTAETIHIPDESVRFVRSLCDSGYEITFVSASPLILVEKIVARIGVPSKVIGLEFDGVPLSAENKEKLIRKYLGDVDLIVGNPGREPFYIARESIIVNNPRELGGFICERG